MTLRPCGSCPYRRDVPSGVWSREEYDKLPEYDDPQCLAPAFFCHQQNGELCAGWVGCHDMDNSIGLRLSFVADNLTEEQYREALYYQPQVPIFESGKEARDHGVRDIETPSPRAIRVVQKLGKKLEL